jgi:membrane protease YdiL (CAAX protease family)
VAVALGLFPVVGQALVQVDLALGTPLTGGLFVVFGELVIWGCVLWWLGYVSRTRGSGSFREDYGLSLHWPADLGPGIGIGLLAFAAQIAIGIVLMSLTRTHPASTTSAFTHMREDGDPLFWVTLLLPVVGAPFVEELVFRGLTMRAMLRRVGPQGAAVGSAALFGLFHWRIGSSVIGNLELATILGFSGYLFAKVDLRHHGRLGPGMVAHATINTITTLFIVLTVR